MGGDMCEVFFFQAEDGIRGAQESRGLGDVYKRQLQGGANLLRRLGFTPEEIALRQAAAVAALPPPVVRKIRRPILIPRERMSHPDLAGLTGKTYNIAYNRKMRRLSKERRLAEMPPRPPIPPGGVNSKHPELHGVQRHRYKTEFRRMQSRKFIAAGLRCDGGPRKSKHRTELALSLIHI